MLKIMVGAAPHHITLKSGEIKYQKSKPANPMWRVIAIDSEQGKMLTRLFPTKPIVTDIEATVVAMATWPGFRDGGIIVPDNVLKLCPVLLGALCDQGIHLYKPLHGFDAGARAGRYWTDFISSLEWQLNLSRESMATCEEIAAATGNELGIIEISVTGDRTGDSIFNVSKALADKITRSRGRDPKVGQKIRLQETAAAPLNRGKHMPPQEDSLEKILLETEYRPGQELTEFGSFIREIALTLRSINTGISEEKKSLLVKLGELLVRKRFEEIPRQQFRMSSIDNLTFHYLRDSSLRSLLDEGVEEALKRPITTVKGVIAVMALPIKISYPDSCHDISLKAIPAHHHVEKAIQESIWNGHLSQVALDPFVKYSREKLSNTVSSVHFDNRFLNRLYSVTPINPSKCFESIKESTDRRSTGHLIVNVFYTQAQSTPESLLGPGKGHMDARITSMVNERLARTGKGVVCKIGPLRHYGFAE